LKTDTIIVRRMPVISSGATPYPNALLPQDQAGAELLAKIPLGEDVAVKIMRDRSLPQHRLFWSVLRYVAEASEWETAEKLLVALKLRLGRYDLMKLPSGKVVPVPDSISFAAMTQDDFQQFMDKSIAIICSEVLPGMDSDRLIAEAEGLRPDMLRASLEATP
jgi:LPS O-antigen subunit length determinant protein (WzzB/FepE family)